MQELEKILEEIKSVLKDTYLDIANNYDVSDLKYDSDKVACVAGKFRCLFSERIDTIIRKHMSGKDKDVPTNNGWIPAEERLPTKEECEKDNNEFLVQTDTGERLSCEYDPLSNGYDNPLWCCNVPVVAWRPLPEPYHPEKK